MDEKDLFKRISEESEDNVPDVYGKILFAAHAEGLFNSVGNTEAYPDGEAVVLGGVNRKAIAITTLASVAAVCLAVALPIALSDKYDGGLSIPPLGNDGNKIVADIGLGDTYAYGAVTTARLAESFINEPAGAKATAKRTAVSENDFDEFGTYFSALDCFLGNDLVQTVTTPTANYQKSLTVSGRRVSGNPVDYSMYYTEYKIVKNDYVPGNPVDYYLEGEIIVAGYGTVNLIGERTLSTDADDAVETAFNVYAYPDLNDRTTYVQMKLEFEEIDGITVKSYSYKVVSNDGTVSSAVAYKSADDGLVIKIKDGETDKGIFTVLGEADGGGYKGNFDFGKERGEFTVKVTDNGLKYELPDPAEENSFLGYSDNGDGTYSVSTYDKNAALPEALVIPSTYNGKPVVSVLSGAFRNSHFKKVVIGEGVTKLETGAFSSCSQLEEVVFPSTLTVIGNQSFMFCDKLKELNLPSGLTRIGEWAFASCSGLTEVTVPGGVTAISTYAFSNCGGLVSLSLPASVAYISYGLVHGCSALESITVEAGNPVYHSAGNCLIDTENTTLIAGCKTSVIPDDGSVTVIGEYAFSKMGLTGLNLPSAVKSIRTSAFSENDFTFVSLPEGLEYIGVEAFVSCVKLEVIGLPSTLIGVGGYAFEWCRKLLSVNIPENVQYIEIGAFNGCDALTELTVDPANAVYSGKGNCIINKSTKTLEHGCKGSVIPDDGSVEAIGNYAFAYNRMYSIVIPYPVKRIGYSAFLDCDLQLGLVMEGVTHIGESAFAQCYFSVVEFSDDLKEIGESAFENCSGLISVILPEGVTTVGDGAFCGCSALEKVVLPSTVQNIGEKAFSGCRSLTNIIIPGGITRIKQQTFYNCSALESVTVPQTVTGIDFQAFYGCAALREIGFGGAAAEWADVQKDGETWDWDTGDYVVKCTDGTLSKDGSAIN